MGKFNIKKEIEQLRAMSPDELAQQINTTKFILRELHKDDYFVIRTKKEAKHRCNFHFRLIHNAEKKLAALVALFNEKIKTEATNNEQ